MTWLGAITFVRNIAKFLHSSYKGIPVESWESTETVILIAEIADSE